MKNVLILCTGNSCRSQMAQVIWQSLGKGEWHAESAGSNPSGYVHPLAIVAIADLGLSTEGLTSKSLTPFLEKDIDLVVTVCDNAHEACPALPNAKQTLHWPFEDPADAVGTDEEQLATFFQIRDEIKARISGFLDSSQ